MDNPITQAWLTNLLGIHPGQKRHGNITGENSIFYNSAGREVWHGQFCAKDLKHIQSEMHPKELLFVLDAAKSAPSGNVRDFLEKNSHVVATKNELFFIIAEENPLKEQVDIGGVIFRIIETERLIQKLAA